PAVAHHLPVRAAHRRPGGAVRRTGREPVGPRRDPRAVRPRPADLGAIRELRRELGAWRFRPIVLLPHAGVRPLSLAPAELAHAGARRHGVLAPDRHPERHPRRGAGGRLLGPGRQDLRPARALGAVVLDRPGADPVLLGLSAVAALVRVRYAIAYSHAGLRTRLVFRRRPHAAHSLLDA